MILKLQRITIVLFSSLFFIAAIIAAYFQQPLVLAIPFGLLICFFLIRQPETLIYILIASIPWSIEFSFNGSLATDLPDEPLMILTSLVAVIFIIYNHRQLKSNFHPLIWLLLLQFFWSLITLITSTNVLVSIKYVAAKSWYLFAFVAAPLIFFKNERMLFRSACILVISMFIVTVITLFRHSEYHFTFASINSALQPFFRNHVNYSSLLVCMIPIQIVMISLTSNRSFKVLISIFFIITLSAVFLSYARGAWLALTLGLISYLLIRLRLLFVSFLFFIMLCTVSLYWLNRNDNYLRFSNDYKTTIFHPDFKEHLLATYEMKDMSTAERFYRWVAGVRMIKDSWKTGFGPTTFYQNYKSYTEPAFKTWVSKNEEHSTVHNYYLLMIIEQGVMGLFLFILLLGTSFWYSQYLYSKTDNFKIKIIVTCIASLLVMISTIIFLSDMIETDKIGSIFYLAISSLILTDYKTEEKQSDLSTNI